MGICEILNRLLPEGTPYERLIEFVKDRPGHDRRYSIDPSKIEKNLNWNPKIPFQSGLEGTVEWYLGQFQAANLEV
jgi:dTDP-glucose 4,6-dehydratase